MSYSGKTIFSSLSFKFIEQLSIKFTSIIVGIVLARLLDVTDFGVVAILTVFIHLSNAVIEGGLSTSLIQKKTVGDIDYSTVFFVSCALAVVLYIALFLSAPFIAVQYENEAICTYLRVIGIALFFTPFNATQLGYIYRNMHFKRLMICSFTACVLSGSIGILMAYRGFGAWALIAQTIINGGVCVVMLLFLIPWKPKLLFSFSVLKEHFAFGWKLLVSSLLDTMYNEMRSLVIGKKYTADDLAYYNRGESYPKTIMTSLNTSVQTVMFPVLSSEQDNPKKIKDIMRKTVSTSSFILFPIMAGMAAVAESFVLILLTDKWMFCVPYLKLSCLAYAILPINSCNLQAIKAIGRSDVFLAIDIIKKLIGFTILFLTAFMFNTPMAIAIGVAIYAPIQLIINALPNKKLINYSIKEQFNDVAIPLIMSLIMFGGVSLLNLLEISVWVKLLLQIASGFAVYLALSLLFRVKTLTDIIESVKKRRRKVEK